MLRDVMRQIDNIVVVVGHALCPPICLLRSLAVAPSSKFRPLRIAFLPKRCFIFNCIPCIITDGQHQLVLLLPLYMAPSPRHGLSATQHSHRKIYRAFPHSAQTSVPVFPSYRHHKEPTFPRCRDQLARTSLSDDSPIVHGDIVNSPVRMLFQFYIR